MKKSDNKRVVTIKKSLLHSEKHHSFMFDLSGDELFKIMTALSAERYRQLHGMYPDRLDKTKVSTRALKEM